MRVLLVTSLAVAGVLAATGVAAAQAPPVPGAQTERFRLVLEGEGRAVRDLDLGATTGNCSFTVNAHLTEEATWRRGRGVTLEFLRLGTGRRAVIFMRRPGSPAPVFTVNVASTRRSSGSASRTGPPECIPVTEDLAQGPECGIPARTNANISLTYTGGLLRVRTSGLGTISDIRCPESTIYGGTPDLKYAWPSPLPIRPELLPPSLIFGTKRAFVIRMAALRKRTSEPLVSGTLSGNVTDVGENRVTIRFIRL